MSQAFTTSTGERRVAAIAAQCVMCGLCLPHCPSYAVTRNEAESPRGRLALMARIAEGEINSGSHPTLDSCLACGRCELVCPPKVPFIEALTLTRTANASVREHWTGKLARQWLRRPALLRLLMRNAVAVRAFLPASLRRRANLDGLAPIFNARAMPPLPTGTRNMIGSPTLILAGCAAQTLERGAVEAITIIATASGTEPMFDNARCCGALGRHLGHPTLACAPIVDDIDCAVAINSGCTAHWRQQLAPHEVLGVVAWLEQRLVPLSDRLTPRPLRVALHLPCTQQRLVGETDALRRLIDQLPGAIPIELPAQPGCCGAAGSYCMNQPLISQQLSSTVAEQIRALAPDVVVSTNGGCRAQLAQALFDLGASIRLLHPAELIAAYLTGSPI